MSEHAPRLLTPWIEARCADQDFQRFFGVATAQAARDAAQLRCGSDTECDQLKQEFLTWFRKDLGLPNCALKGLD